MSDRSDKLHEICGLYDANKEQAKIDDCAIIQDFLKKGILYN
jgi:hypothetical protein